MDTREMRTGTSVAACACWGPLPDPREARSSLCTMSTRRHTRGSLTLICSRARAEDWVGASESGVHDHGAC